MGFGNAHDDYTEQTYGVKCMKDFVIMGIWCLQYLWRIVVTSASKKKKKKKYISVFSSRASVIFKRKQKQTESEIKVISFN